MKLPLIICIRLKILRFRLLFKFPHLREDQNIYYILDSYVNKLQCNRNINYLYSQYELDYITSVYKKIYEIYPELIRQHNVFIKFLNNKLC